LPKILETFFLAEEKRSIHTRNFHRKNIFHDLSRWPAPAGLAGMIDGARTSKTSFVP
jgi:hypothetical protein